MNDAIPTEVGSAPGSVGAARARGAASETSCHSASSYTRPQGAEPPMYLQRPSSPKSQDIAHVLARTFRQVFTRDPLEPEVVKNLTVSRGGNDAYHEKYVEKLRLVQEERERRLDATRMLERHITQAQAQALLETGAGKDGDEESTAEGGVGRGSGGGGKYVTYLDSQLLREHGLVAPDDFLLRGRDPGQRPRPPDVPHYATTTTTKNVYREKQMNKVEKRRRKKKTVEMVTVSKKFWDEQLKPFEREQERNALQRLNTRLNHLKNPRFLPIGDSTGAKTLAKAPLTMPTDDAAIFVATPSEILFHDFVVGRVYESVLELKNISSSLRPVRVVPPSTPHFAVGLGRFPSDQGLVAPGMNCYFTVRFAPDCLANFDDRLLVHLQSLEPLVVPLKGRRTPPKLAVPSSLDLDECLAGGCKIVRVPVRNFGGHGRFCVVPFSQWPTTNFKSIVSSRAGFVNLAPFEVSPALFELCPEEVITLEVRFRPETVGDFVRKMTLVCDNCTVKHYEIRGRGVAISVELAEAEGGFVEADLGEICDAGEPPLMKLNSVNPQETTRRRIAFRNDRKVALPFEWRVMKPHLATPDPEKVASRGATRMSSRVGSKSSARSRRSRGGADSLVGAEAATASPQPPASRPTSTRQSGRLSVGSNRGDSAPAIGTRQLSAATAKSDRQSTPGQRALSAEIEAPGSRGETPLQGQRGGSAISGESRREVKDEAAEEEPKTLAPALPIERHLDPESPFEVCPAAGVLAPDAETEFFVTFSPSTVGAFHNVVELVLQCVPADDDDDNDDEDDEPSAEGTHGVNNSTPLPQQLAPAPPPAQHDAEKEEEIDSPPSLSDFFSTGPKSGEDLRLKELRVFEMEVKGVAEALNVISQPYAVLVPGQILMGTTERKSLRLVNQSVSAVDFEWSHVHDQHILEVEPPNGRIDASSSFECRVSITGCIPGQLRATLRCDVERMDEPILVPVEALVKGPQIVIQNPSLDFGLICIGDKGSSELTIYNSSHLPAKWRIREIEKEVAERCSGSSPDDTKDPSPSSSVGSDASSVVSVIHNDSYDFFFDPGEGVLNSLSETTIRVTFDPHHCQTVDSKFEILVEDVEEYAILVRAEVQHPKVCLLNCETRIPLAFVGVATSAEISLLNMTMLPTRFAWASVEGGWEDVVDVSVEPAEGEIGPREQRRLTLHFLSHSVGPLSDIRISCHVDGMGKPVCLSLGANVEGLRVTMTTGDGDEPGIPIFDDAADAAVAVDFGAACKLGATVKRFLWIRNETGIAAPFSVEVEHFRASSKQTLAEVTPPPATPIRSTTRTSLGIVVTRSASRPALERTANLGDPKSKTKKKAYEDLCRDALKLGHGLAVQVTPETGTLRPYAEQCIELTAYNDMWGSYSDNVVVRVGNLPPRSIPLRVMVVGCPLNFQMTAAIGDIVPVVRFGGHVSGGRAIQRQMRINNTSPFPIRIDWETFNVHPQDDQLLDMVVVMGHAFPLRDEAGEEIVPPTPAPTSVAPTSGKTRKSLNRRSDAGSLPLPDVIEEEAELAASPPPPQQPPQLHVVGDPVSPDVTSREGSGNHGNRGRFARSASTRSRGRTRENFISVVMKCHEGVRSTVPFDVHPKQLVIGGHASLFIQVSFDPSFQNQNLESDLECKGYALGFLSLDDNVASVPGKVDRSQGHDMTPLRLDMTANVRPASLRVEISNDDGLAFNALMSELLPPPSDPSDELRSFCGVRRHRSDFNLSNHQDSVLQFEISLPDPFFIATFDPKRKKSSAASAAAAAAAAGGSSAKSRKYGLRPSENVQVAVGFEMKEEILKIAERLKREKEEGEPSAPDGYRLDGAATEQRLLIDKFASILFDNGNVQRVPVRCVVHLPRLELSADRIDFGASFVEQDCEAEVVLSNRSHCDSEWRVTRVGSDDDDAFDVTPKSGRLLSFVRERNFQTHLRFSFRASAARSYERLFRVDGSLGEETLYVRVMGKGTMDEANLALFQ